MMPPEPSPSATIDVRHYFRVLRRKKLLIAAVTGLVLLAALGYLARTPVTYTGRSTVIIKVITSTPFENSVRPDLLVVPATEAKIAASTKVADRAAALIGKRGEEKEVRRGVQVNVAPKSQVLAIEYKAPSPKEAAAGANAFAAAYLEHRAAQALDARDKTVAEMTENVNRLREELSRTNAELSRQERGSPTYEDNAAYREVLRLQITNVRDRQSLLATMPTDGGEIVSEAAIPAGPSAPNRTQVLLAALLVGIVLGLVVAFVRDRLDPAIRDAAELEEASGLPLLATIPGDLPLGRRSGVLAAVERPYDVGAEAYRRCRAAIVAMHEKGATRKQILVIDTGRSNAGCEVAANLAVTMQRGGNRVVLIFAEGGHRKLYAALGVRHGPGLSEVLKKSIPVGKALQGKSVRVLTAGVADGELPDLVTGDRMQSLLAHLSASFDYILIGGPSTTARFGTVLELARSSRTVLVAERGRSSREGTRALVSQLDLLGAQWDGCILRGRVTAEHKGPLMSLAAQPGASTPIARTEPLRETDKIGLGKT